MKKLIGHSDDIEFEKDVEKLLLFRKIVKVEQIGDQTGVLTLDNGIRLIVEGNEGCGGCGNGWFYLDELNGCDNAITDVECVVTNGGEYEDDLVYHIFVFAADERKHCLTYSGYDNGYYGTGYHLYVEISEDEGK